MGEPASPTCTLQTGVAAKSLELESGPLPLSSRCFHEAPGSELGRGMGVFFHAAGVIFQSESLCLLTASSLRLRVLLESCVGIPLLSRALAECDLHSLLQTHAPRRGDPV